MISSSVLSIELAEFIRPGEQCCLLSIKPKYVEQIVNGNKLYEYRKKIFKREVSKAFIYTTRPVAQIVGYFVPGEILYKSPDIIWEETCYFSGLTQEEFSIYCKRVSHIYAINIAQVIKFPEPISLKRMGCRPPQSFFYI